MINPESPYEIHKADELRNNKELHDEKIRYFTNKYANINIAPSVYEKKPENWDFSYNP